MNFCKVFFSKLIKTCDVHLFGDIIGYDHIKRVFGMALDADCVVHILLVGPPASAKTMFLTSLMHHLKRSYFADGTNSTKEEVFKLFEQVFICHCLYACMVLFMDLASFQVLGSPANSRTYIKYIPQEQNGQKLRQILNLQRGSYRCTNTEMIKNTNTIVRGEVIIVECRVINLSGTTSVEAIYSREALRSM